MSYHTNPQPPGDHLRGYQKPPGYPQYPGQPPRRPRSRVALWLTGGLVAGILVLAAAAVSSVDTEEPGDAAAAGESSGGQDVYAVGQTAHSGDSDITVHAVTDPYTDPSGFWLPDVGIRWVAVEVTITNPSDELVTWSSLLQAEMTDSMSRPWNIAIMGSELPQLDGDIPIQGERRGWVLFAVASDATGLQLRIKGNITATGSLFQL